MNTILLILGVLALGAVAISAYVFTVAARNYVSDDKHSDESASRSTLANDYTSRAQADRRKLKVESFPITVSGLFIQEERRIIPDRRLLA